MVRPELRTAPPGASCSRQPGAAGHPRRRRAPARSRSRAGAPRAGDDLARAGLGSRLRRRPARCRTGTAGARSSSGSHGRHLTPPRTWRRGHDHALRVRRRGAASTAPLRSAGSARHDVGIECHPGSPARGPVPGQCPRLGRSERCVRCDHRLDDGLGHPPGTRRRHADHRGARHARFLRRVSSSTKAWAHVPCGRIRRRGVNHVAAGVQRRTGRRSESSPVADPGRRSSARWPDRLRGRPRLARDWCHARRLRGARRGGGLLGAVGYAGVVPRRAFSERTPSRRPVPARRWPDESRDVHRRRSGADADTGQRIGV